MTDFAINPTPITSYDPATGIHTAEDGSAWVSYAVPLVSMEDGGTDARLKGGRELTTILHNIGKLSRSITGQRRRTSHTLYRELHLLVVDVPYAMRPWKNISEAQAAALKDFLPKITVATRVAVVSVKLRAGRRLSASMLSKLESFGSNVPDEKIDTGQSVETLYADDLHEIQRAIGHSGVLMTDREVASIHAYFNEAETPNALIVPHRNHVHVFTHASGLQNVEKLVAQKDAEWRTCSAWSPTFPHPGYQQHVNTHRAFAFGTIADWGLSAGATEFDPNAVKHSVLDRAVMWIPHAFRQGVTAVSLRFKLEPAVVTVKELQNLGFGLDEEIDKGEQKTGRRSPIKEQMRTEIEHAVEYLATTREPTICYLSGVVVGVLGRENTDWERGFNWEGLSSELGITIRPASNQLAALDESLIGSTNRTAPTLLDSDALRIGYSGFQSCTALGDDTGIFFGRGRRDRQPVLMDIDRSVDEDSLPIIGVIGQTGAGKAVAVRNVVPIKDGWVRMGDLKIGDKVIGRDGKPCTVLAIYDHPTPVMYEFCLSDGQKIVACEDHQWLVSDYRGRSEPSNPHKVAAQAAWDKAVQTQQILEKLIDGFDSGDEAGLVEFEALLSEHVGDSSERPWGMQRDVKHLLNDFRVPSREILVEHPVKLSASAKVDPAKLYRFDEAVETLRKMWSKPKMLAGKNRESTLTKLAALDRIEVSGELVTAPEVARRFTAAGGPVMKGSAIGSRLKKNGLIPVDGFAEVRLPGSDGHMTKVRRVLYPTKLALQAIVDHLHDRYGTVRPTNDIVERVVTTKTMIEEGVTRCGRKNWAIRTTEPLQFPEKSLLVDPYVLGAWLGDGTSSSGDICLGSVDSCADKDGLTDHIHMLDQIRAAGYETVERANPILIGVNKDLPRRLRVIGVLNDKHIPVKYLRASYEQRLALLQGLMDTDGTIDKNGKCELTLSDKALATGALELIRTMGIKASMRSSAHKYHNPDDAPGVYREAKDRHRITFTTMLPVFRLPRKLERLPKQLRSTQNQIYVTDIRPVPSEPGRCITVDSPDSTYLVEGMVPTHNTMVIYSMVTQRLLQGFPVALLDFKRKNTNVFFAKVLQDLGIPVTIASLDDLTSVNGLLDPIRNLRMRDKGLDFGNQSPEGVAAQQALEFLGYVDLWKSSEAPMLWESRLETGLTRAVADPSIRCLGDALRNAEYVDPEIGLPLLDYAEGSPVFGLVVGTEAEGPTLNADEGLTVYELRDAALPLPESDEPRSEWNLQQRVSVAVLSQLLNSTMSALAYKRAMVMIDECWLLTLSNPGVIKRQARVARQFGVTIGLASQQWSDIQDLEGYMTRKFLGNMADKEEAKLGMESMGIPVNDVTLSDIQNFKALFVKMPDGTRRLLRPALWWMADADKRVGIIEMLIPPMWLKQMSTNTLDREHLLAELTALRFEELTEAEEAEGEVVQAESQELE